jgi:spore maturation protein A
MNILFTIVFLLSTATLLFLDPDSFLETMLDGASKSASTCFALIATYAVWLGLMRVWEDSGVARGVSRFVKPLARRLLKTDNEKALDVACMNFSVNLLGISGAATPYGIQAANLLDKTPNAEYSSAMLFVLNATSLQLFPSSMIAVRVAMHSAAPNDILLPSLLTTVFSTALGVILTRLLIKPHTMSALNVKKSQIPHKNVTKSIGKIIKTRGAGI